MHGHPKGCPIEGNSACSARELEEYEDVQGDTELEGCGSVEVAMQEWGDGVKYVKDGWGGWTPVVRSRRKKNARSEKSESRRNLKKKFGDVEEGGWDPKSLYSRKFESF